MKTNINSTSATSATKLNGEMRNSILTTALVLALFGGGASTLFAADSSEKEGSSKSSESKSESGSNSESSGNKGGKESEVQSSARPFGLSTVGKVMIGGSDDNSAKFKNTVLPGMNAMLNSTLGETRKVDDSMHLLDPSKLKLNTMSDVRVYFVGEGAGYQNTLGFNTAGGGIKTGDPKLIFPNASSPVSTYDPLKSGNRTASAPLLPGDFANLGTFRGGTKLDFFLIANGANGGQNVFSTDQSVNPDHINHVVSFAYAVKDSPYLVISFEDLYGGGDRDFNDVIIAVDIGAHNVAAILGTPEPGMMLTLGGFLGGVVWLRQRRTLAAA